MITTIIWDIGGVLLTPSEKITPYIVSQLFQIPLRDALERYQRNLGDLRSGKMSVRDLMADIGHGPTSDTDLNDLESRYAEFYSSQAIVNPQVASLLVALKGNVALLAFSNMLDMHVRINKERGLFAYFDRVYVSSEIGYVKPDRKGFEYLMTDSQVTADQCVFIDDIRENVDVALEMGIVSHKFETIDILRAFLNKQGVNI